MKQEEIEMQTPPPENQYLSVREAAKITGVPYQTLVTANYAEKLEFRREYAGAGDHVLWVHVGALAEFMINDAPSQYRWLPEPVEIKTIHPNPATQIRPIDKTVVKKLADQIRQGGRVVPVWIICSEDGCDNSCDGNHRTHGCLAAGKKSVDAIRIRLPFRFARALAIYSNQRHGSRLRQSDMQKLVTQFLQTNQRARTDLDSGKLSMGALADEVGVSISTVSRALDFKSIENVDAKTILAELKKLNPHLEHENSEDAAFIAFIYHVCIGRVASNLSAAQKADFKRRIKLNASPICGSLTPTIRSLLFQQGGARKRGKFMTVETQNENTNPSQLGATETSSPEVQSPADGSTQSPA